MFEDKVEKTKNNGKIFFMNLLILVIFVFVSSVISKFPNFEEKEREKVELSDINKICELATMKCYYHDVIEYQKDSKGLFNYGKKKMWMEYDGIVTIGIDVGKVKVENPTDDGVVRIYVPKATILDADANEDSISDPVEDNGIFTKITAEERAQAFSSTQTTMKEKVEEDENLLNQAHNNAKELLKRYVVNVGRQIGQDYSVEWIEDKTTDEKEK